MLESPRPVYPNELYHYGVKGMHWGIRRYQPYPKGYSGKGKYLGKIQGGSKVDKLTEEEKIRRRRRNIAIASGALGAAALAGAGYVAYKNRRSVENKIRDKGNKAFNESLVYKDAAANEGLSGTDKLLYRDDLTFAERKKLAQPNFDRADKFKRKSSIKLMQGKRYDNLAEKVSNRRDFLAGGLHALGSAGIANAVRVIRKNRKRKKKR